jgi:uncharacterized repeat protein (TIGR01451 family)
MKNIIQRKFYFIIFLLSSFHLMAQFESEQLINTLPTGGVTSVNAADFDNDGDLDVLSSSSEDNSICWFEHIGGGNFKPKKKISDNAIYASCAYPADFDNDGDIDVVYSSILDSYIAWFENNGLAEFSAEQIIYSDLNDAKAIWAGDLDGDSKNDVVFIDNDKIGWFKNLGNGTFSTLLIISNDVISSFQLKLEVDDLDNDGDLDIISRTSSHLYFHKNNGDGTFLPGVEAGTTTFSEVSSYTLGDMDGDGFKDIILQQGGTNIKWSLNNGNGTFGALQILYNDIGYTRSILAGDFDSDGDTDLSYTTMGNNTSTFGWLENTGSGTLGTPQIIFAEYASISDDGHAISAAFDLDFDGNLELLLNVKDEDRIDCYLGLGSGTFANPTRVSGQVKGSTSIYNSDIDNDGLTDIISSGLGGNFPGVISWFKNKGDGTFDAQRLILDSEHGSYVIHGQDIDNDGLPELFMCFHASQELIFMKNLGQGNFGSIQVLDNSMSNVNCIKTLDYDLDGNLDLFVGSDDGLILFKNLGLGIFDNGENISAGTDDFEFIDSDNDGFTDIRCASYNGILMVRNQGNGSFVGSFLIPNTQGANSLEYADLDNDGDKDIVFSSDIVFPNVIAWCENIDGNSFGVPQLITNAIEGVRNIVALDFDMDNDIDIASASQSDNKIAWYENLGNGSFSGQQVISDQSESAQMILSFDFDSDGDNDLFSASRSDSKISMFQNGVFGQRQVRGQFYFDENQNGVRDQMEHGLSLGEISTTPENAFGYSYASGNYFVNIDQTISGSYQIAPVGFSDWNITSDSAIYNISVDSSFTFVDSLDFGFYPASVSDSLVPSLSGALPRCNTVINYWINARNVGTTISSGIIKLELAPEIQYVSSAYAPDSIVGQQLYWHYDSLFYFENKNFSLQVQMPDFNSMGDTLRSFLTLKATNALGNVLYQSTDTLSQILVCAYDPNRKIVSPAGEEENGYIPVTTTQLEYQIDFQNTGNDTALVVVIKDYLDSNLIWSSFTPVSSSHPMRVDIFPGGELNFVFDDIMLPDSTVNEVASHGFVRYKIDLRPNLLGETPISNTAFIYFDQNPAIVTNTVTNMIMSEVLSFEEITNFENSVIINPNPFDDKLLIKCEPGNEFATISIFSISGQKIAEYQNLSNKGFIEIDVSNIGKGMYYLTGVNANTNFTRKILKN